MKSPLEERKRMDPSDILSIDITLPSFLEMKFCTSGNDRISSLIWFRSLRLAVGLCVNLSRSSLKLTAGLGLSSADLEKALLTIFG